MMSGLIDNTMIPVLGEVIQFAQARHNVMAGNIANLDTPGYQARDLSVNTFQEQLARLIDGRRAGGSSSLSDQHVMDAREALRQLQESPETIMRHDGAKVGMEQQVLEISKNQYLHNLAITIMGSQFRLLQAMVSERSMA